MSTQKRLKSLTHEVASFWLIHYIGGFNYVQAHEQELGFLFLSMSSYCLNPIVYALVTFLQFGSLNVSHHENSLEIMKNLQ
jgi:hypothetical protein